MGHVHDGERELLREDAARTVFVWGSSIREPGRKHFSVLNRLVEALTEAATDRCVEPDLVQQFKPRVFVIANYSHL